jgi:hypothetical protein
MVRSPLKDSADLRNEGSAAAVPIVWTGRLAGSRLRHGRPQRNANMGKGNNSRKNDKKNLKPKQDKTKPAAKK